MNTGLKRSNEELVTEYQSTQNESLLQELLIQNEGLFYKWAGMYVETIPKAEIEDLVSEAYFPFIKAVNNFKAEMGCKFSTVLGRYVAQHYDRIYNHENRQKRSTGLATDSYERLTEINKDGVADMEFTVDCDDFASFEFSELIKSLDLNEIDQVLVNVLMEGGKKIDVAKMFHISPASIDWHIKQLRKKFILAGYEYAL